MMSEDPDLSEFVKEFKKVLDDSMEILADLEYDVIHSKEDELIPITNVQELDEVTDDLSHFARIKKAESDLFRRKYQ